MFVVILYKDFWKIIMNCKYENVTTVQKLRINGASCIKIATLDCAVRQKLNYSLNLRLRKRFLALDKLSSNCYNE
jgi:hypothetical protein